MENDMTSEVLAAIYTNGFQGNSPDLAQKMGIEEQLVRDAFSDLSHNGLLRYTANEAVVLLPSGVNQIESSGLINSDLVTLRQRASAFMDKYNQAVRSRNNVEIDHLQYGLNQDEDLKSAVRAIRIML